MASVEIKSVEPFDDQPVATQQASMPTTLHIPEIENAIENSPARPPRAVLTFEKLTVQTDGSARRFNVLDNVSGMIGPGLTAIMGPTGSGKSVLLNTLLGHVPPGLEKTSGTVCLNGKTFTAAQAFFSLVHQIDELSGSLTVGETLSYAAELQLSHLTPKRRAARVTQLLQDLGLSHVRNVLVGGALRKGISGGQRKRVSIALGLLASPSLLVLDEPTAGLDSVTAMRVLTLLKALAERDGTTVLCVIHQPQRAIYELLDRLILLRSGEIIYDGDAGSCVSHLASIGYEYDGVTNPADHIMEVISPALGETQDALRERCLTRRDYFAHEHSIDHNINNKVPLPRAPSRVTAASQFRVLIARQFLNEVRSYQMHLVNLVITLLSSFLIGATWYRMDKNGAGSQALRTPAVFFCVINQSLFGAMKSVLAFPEHRSLMLRERRAKLYTAFPAFAAWMTVDFLSTLPWTIIYCVVSYFMMGLRTDSAGHFFIFLVLLFFAKVVASAMAIFVCSLAAISGSATAATMATVILPVVLELSRLFGGFFLPPSLLPGYFKWLDPLSYVKYGYVGAALNELDGLTLACPPGAASCNPRASDAQIKSLRLDFISVGGCIGGLIGFYLGFCIVSYILLRLSKH